MAKKKVRFSKKSVLDADEFDLKHLKVKITIMLDGDVLDAVKRSAIVEHTKYQTLINHVLREKFIGRSTSEDLKALIENLKIRVENLEHVEPEKKRA